MRTGIKSPTSERCLITNSPVGDSTDYISGGLQVQPAPGFGGHMAEPWKTDKWFISPWCYLPEVVKNYNFAPKIKIHDVTLRDG
jgi:hypothetical protein